MIVMEISTVMEKEIDTLGIISYRRKFAILLVLIVLHRLTPHTKVRNWRCSKGNGNHNVLQLSLGLLIPSITKEYSDGAQ